jgi:hypothetical protein
MSTSEIVERLTRRAVECEDNARVCDLNDYEAEQKLLEADAADYRAAALRLNELERENAALREREVLLVDALHNVGIGGNHAALLIGSDHPPYTTSQIEAAKHYGGNLDGMNAWFCWQSIMKAMREAYDTLPEDVRNAAWKRMEQRRAALAGSVEK